MKERMHRMEEEGKRCESGCGIGLSVCEQKDLVREKRKQENGEKRTKRKRSTKPRRN
jgi:hypothetical protein